MQPNVTSKSRLGSILNAAAACAVAVLAVINLSAYRGFWDPSTFGEFGFSTGQAGGPIGLTTITDVLPGSPADAKGLRPGDTVIRPATLHDRLLVIGMRIPQPGERLSMTIDRAGAQRTAQLVARPFRSLSFVDGLSDTVLVLELLLFVAVGLVLALLRPSRMTWGFYLFAFALIVAWSPCSCMGYISQILPASWDVTLRELNPLTDLGVAGFLVFCIRFPTNTPEGWRRSVDFATPFLAIALVAIDTTRDLSLIDFRQSMADSMTHVFDAVCLAILAVGTVLLLHTYFGARGLDRYKMKWVVFGLVCAAIPTSITLLSWEGKLDAPVWFFSLLNLLIVPLPLSIGYAVIRHRVIDIRFVLSRSLVFGLIAFLAVLIAAVIDWLVSSRLPTSRADVAIIAGAAIALGFLLSSARQSLSKTIDFLFFRAWLQTKDRAEAIGDKIRSATSTQDLYEPLTKDIARAFSLASAALFERIEDGGFVRVAAERWPAGSLWHLFPGDQFVTWAGERSRVADIDEFQWGEDRVPSGVARPAVMVPLVMGRRVRAMLLFGAHENGTGLDPDEIRSIRRLVSDAALVYGRSPAAAWDQGAFVAQPLSV